VTSNRHAVAPEAQSHIPRDSDSLALHDNHGLTAFLLLDEGGQSAALAATPAAWDVVVRVVNQSP